MLRSFIFCGFAVLSGFALAGFAEDKLATLTVSALDVSGNPVTNLRAEEFQLWIDGRPRKVVFSRFDGARPAHTATVLLLDLLNDRTMNGQEIVDTTVDAMKGLEASEDVYLYILSARGQLVPIHAAPKLDAEIAQTSEPWTRNVEPMLRSAFKNVFGLRSVGDDDVVQRLSMTAGRMLELAHALKAIPARKNLVWVSHGVPLCGSLRQDDDEVVALTFRLRRICEELQQDGIAVYPVMQSARGAAGASSVGSVEDLEEISGLTGGRKYGSGYVREAVRQAVADSRASYQIAYFFPEMKPDSKFHKVRLVSTRENVRLQGKSGFYAVPPFTDPRQAAQDRMQMATRSPFDSSAVHVLASVSRPAGAPQSVRLDVRVDASDVLLRDEEGQRSGRLSLWFSAFDDKGWNQPASPGPVIVRLNAQQYEAALKNGLEFQQPLRVNPGAKRVRAVVVDEQLGSIGSATVALDR